MQSKLGEIAVGGQVGVRGRDEFPGAVSQALCCFLCGDRASNLMCVCFHKDIYCVSSASLAE